MYSRMKNKDGNVMVHYRKSKEINSLRRVLLSKWGELGSIFCHVFLSFFFCFFLFIGWIRSCLVLLLLCTAAWNATRLQQHSLLCDIFILLAYIKISLYSLSLFLPKCLWDIYPHQSFISLDNFPLCSKTCKPFWQKVNRTFTNYITSYLIYNIENIYILYHKATHHPIILSQME
jgi:hypothetical protein